MHKREVTLILLFFIALLLFYLGYRYYEYTRVNPQFCTICHMSEEGIKSWRLSKHSGVVCQRCHELSMIEGNRLLLGFVIKGRSTKEPSHGRKNPWKACLKCHTEEVSQGSVTLRKSFGHARHVFMNEISCESCHVFGSHNFQPDTRLCQRCHPNRLVHGMAMAGLNCLNCHLFGDSSPKFVSQSRCFRCHKGLKMSETMAGIRCFDCHRPHDRLKMKGSDCLGRCHMNEVQVGQHRVHINKAGVDCIYCHRAHTWKVGEENAKRLCSKCHEYRKPELFIY